MKKITPLLVCFSLFCFQNAISSTTYQLDVMVFGTPSTPSEFNSTGYSINGMIQEYDGYTSQPSIHVVVIDSAFCAPVTNCNRDEGQVNIFDDPDSDCIFDASTIYTGRPRPENYFIFRSAVSTQMQSMEAFINSIPNGNYILIYTWFPSAYSTMDASFDSALLGLGASVIPSLADNLPFIFFCKKGDAGTVQEVTGAFANSMITLNATYDCSPTGIDEISSESFNVFPNPAIDKLKIEFPGQGNLRMFDATGKIVFEKTDVQNNVVVSATEFRSGIYFLELTTEGKRICKKVSVSRE